MLHKAVASRGGNKHARIGNVADPPPRTATPVRDIAAQWHRLEKWCAAPVGYNPSLLRPSTGDPCGRDPPDANIL